MSQKKFMYIEPKSGVSIRVPDVANGVSKMTQFFEECDFKGIDKLDRAEFVAQYMTAPGQCKDVSKTVEGKTTDGRPFQIVYSQTSKGDITAVYEIPEPQRNDNPSNITPSAQYLEMGSIKLPPGEECGEDWKSDLDELTQKINLVIQDIMGGQTRHMKIF